MLYFEDLKVGDWFRIKNYQLIWIQARPHNELQNISAYLCIKIVEKTKKVHGATVSEGNAMIITNLNIQDNTADIAQPGTCTFINEEQEVIRFKKANLLLDLTQVRGQKNKLFIKPTKNPA